MLSYFYCLYTAMLHMARSALNKLFLGEGCHNRDQLTFIFSLFWATYVFWGIIVLKVFLKMFLNSYRIGLIAKLIKPTLILSRIVFMIKINANFSKNEFTYYWSFQDSNVHDRPGSVLGRTSPFGSRLGMAQSPTKQRRSPSSLYRFESCYCLATCKRTNPKLFNPYGVTFENMNIGTTI